MGFIILLAALAALVVIVLALAAREPAYAIARDASYFVAIRGGEETPVLAPDVAIRWSGRADFCFIGGGEAYWSSFFVLAGGDGARMPIDLGDAEDAYVARVAFGAPPRLALGALKLLVLIGILARPRGEASLDLQAKGYRSELMPEQAAVARLLAQKPSYAPSMVNFLAYYASARYGEGRASSGAGAYRLYGVTAMRTVYRTGGHLLFYGRIRQVLRDASSGPTTGAWSDVAAMHYPNPGAILSMEHAPDYRAALRHRDAGLERTVVIASLGNSA